MGCALLATPLQAACGVCCVCVCFGLETFVSNYAGFSFVVALSCMPSKQRSHADAAGSACVVQAVGDVKLSLWALEALRFAQVVPLPC